MNKVKGGKAGREEPIEDPRLIRSCLSTLQAEGGEFPIKVEGTSTLPYASQLIALDGEKGSFILKLVRPLPHELALGAVFRMVFTVDGQRYEALTVFRGREAYLQYRFEMPSQLFHSDRRRHRRFPFRPRESAYVIGQSGVLVGVGIAGPLANISMGGLALRLDRLIRLEDKLRLPIHLGSLDVGAVFDRIRIQDLPRLPLLETRGRVAHLSSRGDEVILGLEFGDMGGEELRSLQASLEFREKLSRGSGGLGPRSGPAGGAASPGPRSAEDQPESEGAEDQETAPELSEADNPLRLLQRRASRIGLIMAPSEARDGLLTLLGRHGYLRVEVARDLEQGRVLWAQETGRPGLILAAGPASPQGFQELLERQGDTPGVFLTDAADPALMMGMGGHSRVLPLTPQSDEDEEHWVRTVDGLLEIED